MMYQILALAVICLTTSSLVDGSKKHPTPFEVWLEGPGVPGPVYSSPKHSAGVYKYVPRTSTHEKLVKNKNEPERHFLEYIANDEENELFPEDKKTTDVDVDNDESSSDGIQLDNEEEAEVPETKSYFYQPSNAKAHKESPIKKTNKPMKRFPRSSEVVEGSIRRKRSTIELAPKPVVNDDADEQAEKHLYQKHKYNLKRKTSGLELKTDLTEVETKMVENNKHKKIHHAQLNRGKHEPLVTKVTISTPPKLHKVHSASEEYRGDGKQRTIVETELGDYHEENTSDYASYSSEERLGEDTDAHYDEKHRSQKSRTKKLKSSNKKYASGTKHHKSKTARISSIEQPAVSSSGSCKLYGVYENAKGQIISGTGGCTDEPLKYIHNLLADGSAMIVVDGVAKEYKIGSKIPLDVDNVRNSLWTVNGKLQYCSHFGLYEKLIKTRSLCLKPLEEEDFMQAFEYEVKGLHKMGKLVYKEKYSKRTKLPSILHVPISAESHHCPQDAPPC